VITRSQVFRAGVWCIFTTLALCVALVVAAVFAGCAPKPDASLVLWEQPAPQVAAQAHAREIGGLALVVLPTGSMEPFITGGDWVVVDPRLSYETIQPGQILLYQAGWLPASSPPVVHMAAAKSGDAWIMSGLANAHYENAANGGLHMTRAHYRGRVVQVYTRRVKT